MKQHAAISHNIRKSWLILGLFLLFSVTLGFFIGKLFDAGVTGVTIALLLALPYAIFTRFFADHLILNSLKARKILRENNVHLYEKIRELAEAAQVPLPELYYIDSPAINCLTLGQSHSRGKIIITTGLIEKLSAPETEAVFAHELNHLSVLDTRTGALAATIIAGFPFYAELLRRKSTLFLPLSALLGFFSPLSGLLMHIVVSPKREIEADAAGVLLTRYPQGLSDALTKIGNEQHHLTSAFTATAHLFFTSPFSKGSKGLYSIVFHTHPPIKERLKHLESL